MRPHCDAFSLVPAAWAFQADFEPPGHGVEADKHSDGVAVPCFRPICLRDSNAVRVSSGCTRIRWDGRAECTTSALVQSSSD
jgi:hypothetical protein